MIKAVEMVTLSWFIWVSQCNHTGPYKRAAGGSDLGEIGERNWRKRLTDRLIDFENATLLAVKMGEPLEAGKLKEMESPLERAEIMKLC